MKPIGCLKWKERYEGCIYLKHITQTWITMNRLQDLLSFFLDDRDEKSLYLMAMGVAYDLKEKNECLGTVEFIAC